MCGSVAKWLGSRTCDQQVAGSNPGLCTAECNPGQVVYFTHVPLSLCSIIWYCPMSGGEVIVGLVKSNDSLPPGLWLRSPAGWLPRTRSAQEPYTRFQYWTTFISGQPARCKNVNCYYYIVFQFSFNRPTFPDITPKQANSTPKEESLGPTKKARIPRQDNLVSQYIITVKPLSCKILREKTGKKTFISSTFTNV